MQNETVIWGLAPNESKPYMEQILFHRNRVLSETEIKTVKNYAESKGYHAIRVAIVDLSQAPKFI